MDNSFNAETNHSIIDERKRKEIEYYDKDAVKRLISPNKKLKDFHPIILNGYRFLYQWLEDHCQNKKILDYGCRNGFYTDFLAEKGAGKVIGIDLSEKSLEIAREKIKEKVLRIRLNF